MLTGDKTETAIEVARACKLFTDHTKFIDLTDISSFGRIILSQNKNLSNQNEEQYALIINGEVLTAIMESENNEF